MLLHIDLTKLVYIEKKLHPLIKKYGSKIR